MVLNQTKKQPFGAKLFCIKKPSEYLGESPSKKLMEELYFQVSKNVGWRQKKYSYNFIKIILILLLIFS